MSRARFRVLFASVALVSLAGTGCGDKGDKPGSGDAKPAGSPGGDAKAAPPADAGGYGYAANLGGADLDRQVGDAIKKGRKFLLSKRDDASGGWALKSPASAGMTALATTALIASTARSSVASDPTITKALEFLASRQKPNGSISGENTDWSNYETSASIGAFATAKVPKFLPVQTKARDYVTSIQVQGDEKDVNFGGQPYEKEDPPYTSDLSNAQWAAEAAHAAGLPPDAPFFQRQLKFLGRSQNRAETNDISIKRKVEGQTEEKEVVSGNDGGAGYGPGQSQAGFNARADGKLEARSYGSMTYALLKCLLFAGVKADDPRVQAAVAWISKNFTVEKNPGFDEKDPKLGQQGYYYYVLTMARALAEYERATGKPLAVKDAAGGAHEWRRELAQRLVSQQKPDGTWVNEKAERWQEGDPLLATAYVVQALAICQGRLP